MSKEVRCCIFICVISESKGYNACYHYSCSCRCTWSHCCVTSQPEDFDGCEWFSVHLVIGKFDIYFDLRLKISWRVENIKSLQVRRLKSRSSLKSHVLKSKSRHKSFRIFQVQSQVITLLLPLHLHLTVFLHESHFECSKHSIVYLLCLNGQNLEWSRERMTYCPLRAKRIHL